jgi:hypothetical protein
VVRRAPGQPAETNALPILFDVLFDEPVLDFPVGVNAGGIVFTGTASGLHYVASGAEDAYRVTVRSVQQDGDLALSIPAELVADLFGNVNRRSEDEEATVHYDATRPQSVIQSEQEGVVNDGRMDIFLVFSEPVFGLRDSALTLENATLARISGEDGDSRYHFAVTPRADGTTAVTVPEDAVSDAAGNGNTASPIFSLVVDSTGPEVVLTSFETPQASNSWVMRLHATFSEPVFGFERRDVSISGGSLMNFTAREDGSSFLFDVKPSAEQIRVAIPAGVTRDAIGNPNSASGTFARKIDRGQPSARISVLATVGDTIPVEVRFSEAVFGFEEKELQVSHGTSYRTEGEDGDAVYRYLIEPTGKRSVGLRVRGGVARDLAGNVNKAASARFKPAAKKRASGEKGRAAPPLSE